MNKSKKKLIVDQYNPNIYPFKLYVVKNYSMNDLKKLFDITEKDIEGSWDALTIFGIKYKDEKEASCVVLLSDKIIKSKDTLDKLDTCAHEALHYVIDLMEEIGNMCSYATSESYCYLQGWATKCIYRTLVK